jgi:hypothetical protein
MVILVSSIICLSNIVLLGSQKSDVYILVATVAMFCYITSSCAVVFDRLSPVLSFINALMTASLLGYLIYMHIIYGNQVLDYLFLLIEVAILFVLNICEMIEPSISEGSIFS